MKKLRLEGTIDLGEDSGIEPVTSNRAFEKVMRQVTKQIKFRFRRFSTA